MKSGPTLNGWTVRPRRRRAATRPRLIVVLPTPLWVPATMNALSDPRPRSGPGLTTAAQGSMRSSMRIVSLLPSATDIIHELGLMDSLVGVSEDCNWPPEVRAKPLVARNRVDLSDLTSAQIDELVSGSRDDAPSLY